MFKIEHDFNRRFMAVEYPGVVENVDNMLKTLGGLDKVSDVYCKPHHRLELHFRPDDLYSKPACADKENTSAFLLRVRVKKEKSLKPSTSKESNENNPKISSVKVIGVIDSIYKFKNPFDFQYLPVEVNDDKITNIYDKLYPKNFPNISWLNDHKNDVILPIPAVFCRTESTDRYMFRKEVSEDPYKNCNIIGRTRQQRSAYTYLINFSDTNVPTQPHKGALDKAKLHPTYVASYEIVKKCFEERPIWSRNALLYVSKIARDLLKVTLPAVAFYYITGPWRVMWCRFGYDPREDPSSKIYQTLDFRFNKYDELMFPSSKTIRFRKALSKPQSKTVLIKKSTTVPEEPVQVATLEENSYIFRPGMIPPLRQMFYQYCDIEVPEIQNMIAKLPEVSADSVCHLKSGWLPQGVDEWCRERIGKLIMNELEKPQDNAEASTSKIFNEEDSYISEEEDGSSDDDPNWEKFMT